jgi:hypothetical protein
VLEDHAEATLLRRQPRDIATGKHHPARVGSLEPGDHPERGRLTAAAGAEKRDDLVLLDRERQIVYGWCLLEGPRQPIQEQVGPIAQSSSPAPS